VPLEDLPWRLDPAEGFVVAANQAVTGPTGSVRFSRDFDYGYRAQRIRDLLGRSKQQGAKLQVADMEAIQTDSRNGIAPDLVPILRKEKVDAFTAEAVDLLAQWDFSQPADSAAAAYFNAVWADLLDLTFADEMPEGTRPNGGARWYEVVRALLEEPQDPWWDDRRTPNVVENRDQIIQQALVQARLRLTSILGKDSDRWQWGRLHRLRLAQTPLGSSGQTTPLHWMLNRGPLEMPGGTSTVNAVAWEASSGTFDVTWAPSMRMVVDLSAFDRSRWVNQTGASAHPGTTTTPTSSRRGAGARASPGRSPRTPSRRPRGRRSRCARWHPDLRAPRAAQRWRGGSRRQRTGVTTASTPTSCTSAGTGSTAASSTSPSCTSAITGIRGSTRDSARS
jgi:penicillin amidase